MSARVIFNSSIPTTDNYSVRDNINQICSEPPKAFAATDAPTGMALLRQITQYQQERAQTYERFLNDYPIMSDILTKAMPPERQICKADQEDNLHYLDSALAYAKAQQVPVEEESSFFGTLGDIALGILAIPFSIAGCSSEEDGKEGELCNNQNPCGPGLYCSSSICVYPDSDDSKKSIGESCTYQSDCESERCAEVDSQWQCVSEDYQAPPCVPNGKLQKACAVGYDDVYYFDSCGNGVDLAEDCGDGTCKNGVCVSKPVTPDPTPICKSHDHKECSGGINGVPYLYWYDSCGHEEGIYKSCGDGICENGTCKPKPPCVPYNNQAYCMPGESGGWRIKIDHGCEYVYINCPPGWGCTGTQGADYYSSQAVHCTKP